MNNKKEFLSLVGSHQPDLATAALIIARHFQPAMAVDVELEVIERLSSNAASASVDNAESLLGFFLNEGFRGNTSHYYDVYNSFLNQVLHRRVGIPITLGVVYLAVVKRLKNPALEVFGINFPGHFILEVDDGSSPQLIDVFNVSFTNEEQCYARISESNAHPKPQHFRRATDKDILSRLLENLKAIYWQSGQLNAVLDCLDYQLMIFPESSTLLNQQQRLMHNLKHHEANYGSLH